MDLDFTGGMGGSGNLVKAGPGYMRINGFNATYNGSTAVQDGTLELAGSDNTLPSGTALTMGSGANSGVLFMNGNSQTLGGIASSGTGTDNRIYNGTATASTLTLNNDTAFSFSGVLGGKLTYAHSTDWGVLIPHVQLEWQHEFKDDTSAVTAHFLFDPSETPFTVTGDRLDTDYLRLGFGMSFVLTKGRSGFFMFERSFQDRITQNRLALGLRLEF